MPDVSWIAVVVGTLVAFMLGSVWYGPLFGKAWMEEHKFTLEQLKANFNPAKTYGSTFVLSLIAVYVFAVLVGPDPSMRWSIKLSLAVGVGWIATAIGTNYLFEGSSMRLFLINGGYHVVRFVLVGIVFALLG